MIKEMGIHQIRHDLIQSLQWKDFDQYSTFYKQNTNPHKYLPFAKKKKTYLFLIVNKLNWIGDSSTKPWILFMWANDLVK